MCLELKNIKTSRLFLREWKKSDLNDLYNFASLPGLGEMAGWEHHKNIDESREFLDMLIDFKTVYCIEFEGRAIGSFDFAWDKYKKNYVSIGYSMDKNFWGQGIMTEAGLTILDYLESEYKIDGFCARVYSHNKRSQRLLVRLGFALIKKDSVEYYYEKAIKSGYLG